MGDRFKEFYGVTYYELGTLDWLLKSSDGCTYCYLYGPFSKRYGQNDIIKTNDQETTRPRLFDFNKAH